MSRANECAKERGNDSDATRGLLSALSNEMKSGEAESLALFAGMTPSTQLRQLNGELRGLLDLAGTHLARLPREIAMDALEQWLDAQRARIRPSISNSRQLNLYPREHPRFGAIGGVMDVITGIALGLASGLLCAIGYFRWITRGERA